MHYIQALQDAGVDALWVSESGNVRYLSGFSSPEDARVLLTPEGVRLYTDSRYSVQARQECPAEVNITIARPPQTYERAAAYLQGKTVGFEAEHLTYGQWEALREQWSNGSATQLRPTRGVIEALRISKESGEVAKIRAAQAIADEAYAEIRSSITAGAREVDVALALELAMRRRGAEGVAFETIVASGVRGALPHGRASEKVLQEGELVTLDFGAVKDGYASDMTRTVAVGEVRSELKRLYNAVLDAEERAVAAVKPGIKAGDLDQLARDVLAEHGLAEYFSHSLGHGVGLNVHEGPALRAGSEDVLRPGMVITIEPGVYLPEVGGVRIEDLVLVTPDGYEVLSRSAKDKL